jgi:hypothetical protein
VAVNGKSRRCSFATTAQSRHRERNRNRERERRRRRGVSHPEEHDRPARSGRNLAYDAGYGVGPVVFGLLSAHVGYPAGFALTGVVVLAALPAALRERRAQA